MKKTIIGLIGGSALIAAGAMLMGFSRISIPLAGTAAPQTYFARVQNGIVTQVIAANQTFINSGAVGTPSEWLVTCIDDSCRGKYAGVGYTYDKTNDIFVPPKPASDAVLNTTTDTWDSPSLDAANAALLAGTTTSL